MRSHFHARRKLRGWTTVDSVGERLWRIRFIALSNGRRRLLCERKPARSVMYDDGLSRETETAMAHHMETNMLWELWDKLRQAESDVTLSMGEKVIVARFMIFEYARLPFMRRWVLDRNFDLAYPWRLVAYNDTLLRPGSFRAERFMLAWLGDIVNARWDLLRTSSEWGSFVLSSGVNVLDERIASMEDIHNLPEGEYVEWHIPMDAHCVLRVRWEARLTAVKGRVYAGRVDDVIRMFWVSSDRVRAINIKEIQSWTDEGWQCVAKDRATADCICEVILAEDEGVVLW